MPALKKVHAYKKTCNLALVRALEPLQYTLGNMAEFIENGLQVEATVGLKWPKVKYYKVKISVEYEKFSDCKIA